MDQNYVTNAPPSSEVEEQEAQPKSRHLHESAVLDLCIRNFVTENSIQLLLF